MTTNFIDLSILADEEDRDRYERFLTEVCEELDFEYAAYVGRNIFDDATHGHVNYPESWKRHYMENGFHQVDPTVQAAIRSIAPVDWSRLRRDKNFDVVFKHARDFGISEQGLTVPVRGPFGDVGLLCVTRDCNEASWQRLKADTLPRLQQFAVHIHDAVVRTTNLGGVLGGQSLSNREREILQWTAAGKTQQDVGDILSISSRTVEVHLRSCRDKLHALTTAQAVARAVRMRLISPV